MSNKKIFTTVAILAITTVLSTGSAVALPPQIQSQVMVGTLAGNGNWAPGNATGPRLSTPIDRPLFLGLRPDNNFLLTDTFLGDIKLLENTPDGQILDYSGLAGSPGFTDGTLSAARYDGLVGIAYDPFGYAWIADINNAAIRRIDEANDKVATMYVGGGFPLDIASDQFGNIYTTIQGGAGIKRLTYPTPTSLPDLTNLDISATLVAAGTYPLGITFTPDYTTLFIIDQGDHTIKALYPDNNTSFAPYNNDNVQTVYSGPLANGFEDIVVGSDGTIYVSDVYNNVIWQFASVPLGGTFGTPTLYAGTPSSGGYLDGPASTALFNIPYGIIRDDYDNIYIADNQNFRIREIIHVPDFSEFISANIDENTTALATALNDLIEEIVLSGDITSHNGIFDNPTLAALQALQDLSPEEQLAFLNTTTTPLSYPGMLVVTEFANNKIFNIQSMRAQLLHRKCGQNRYAPASSKHGGTSTSYINAPGGVWIEPMIGYLNRKAENGNPNLQNHIDGIAGGLDYGFSENSILGISFGKTIHRVHYDHRQHKQMIDSYFVSPYASTKFFRERGLFELGGLYARHLNKVTHVVSDSDTREGKEKGHAFAARAFASYKVIDAQQLNIAPYAEAEYTNLQNGEYQELPSDSLSLDIKRHKSAMFRGEGGVMANFRMGGQCAPLTLSTKAGYVRKEQVQGRKVALQNELIDDVTVKLQERSRDVIAAGVQLEYQVAPNAAISASYEGEFAKKYYGQSYSASVGAKIRF